VKYGQRQWVMPERHHRSSVPTFADELTIALLGHPARAGEMTAVHELGALRLAFRVDAEQHGDGFPPISAVGFSVEQSQVKLHVRPVVAGERGTLWRLVEKLFLRHADPPAAAMVASESIVNHTRFATMREGCDAASYDVCAASPRKRAVGLGRGGRGDFGPDKHDSFALIGRQEDDAASLKCPSDLIARTLIHLKPT